MVTYFVFIFTPALCSLLCCSYLIDCVDYSERQIRQEKDKNWETRKRTGQLAQLLGARYWCGRSGVRFPGWSNRYRIANGSPPLRRFFVAVLPRR